jgi:cytochrome P450 family 4
MILFSIAIFALLIFAWYFGKYMKLMNTVKNIPGPPIYPFVGNGMLLIGKSPYEIFKIGLEMQAQYGDYLRLLLCSKIVILLGDPKDIEFLLSSRNLIDKSQEYEFIKPWIGEGLISGTGNHWFAHRKALTPAFHFKILEQFVEIFDRNSDILVEKLNSSQGKPLDIFAPALLCALDNICGMIRLHLYFWLTLWFELLSINYFLDRSCNGNDTECSNQF